tara:strand:+ start:9641 stop:9868 length:228 start_codon:yes stop_codon:yes gene_type:complete
MVRDHLYLNNKSDSDHKNSIINLSAIPDKDFSFIGVANLSLIGRGRKEQYGDKVMDLALARMLVLGKICKCLTHN